MHNFDVDIQWLDVAGSDLDLSSSSSIKNFSVLTILLFFSAAPSSNMKSDPEGDPHDAEFDRNQTASILMDFKVPFWTIVYS